MYSPESLCDFLTKRNINVNSSTWAFKSVLARLIYIFLLLVYIPFFLLSLTAWGKLILSIKLKQFLGRKQPKGKLGIASRKHKIQDMAVVCPEDELDFLVNRSFGYLIRMCFWTPQELALFFLKEQKIKLISDGQLAYVVLYTVFGHSVKWNEERKMFHLTMDGLEDLQLFEGFYWDAREILISADAKKIIIKMDGGEEFHSDCDPKERPNFDLAKLHAQVCLSFMGPGLSHNEVHFLFPSVMPVMSKKHLDHNGVLYKLLSPHFRFTERINYQALRVQKATNNKCSRLDRLFFHWQPFPVTKEIFRESVAKKCKEFYLEKGSEEFDEERDFILSDGEDAPNANGEPALPQNGSSGSKLSTKAHCVKRTHRIFPPEFVTDKDLQKVPYLNFLYQYYKVIRRYVEDLSPYIDKTEWETLSSEVAKYVPRFDKVNMVDAIASYILKVGVYHYCDHGTYTKHFAYQYGCMSMRAPFERLDNDEAWEDLKEELRVDTEEIKRDPLTLILQRDVLRTRSFLNIFVDFIPNPNCNVFLPDTEYHFDEPCPQLAEKRFRRNLRNLDEKLKMQRVIVPLPDPEEGEVRAEGMQLAPLDEIVRTVCY